MRWWSGAAIAALLLLGCSGGASDEHVTMSRGALSRAFDASAAEARVPRDLLVAIAAVEDGLAVPAVRLDLHETAVPAAGPMMLRRGKLDTLARAAALSGASEMDLRRDADLALRAGALVLADLGKTTGAQGADLASWRRAIEEMSGYADDAHRGRYAKRVFATLARGGTFEGRDGEPITLARHDLPPSLVLDVTTSLEPLGTAQYPGAEWIPTSCKNKCTPTRDGNTVEFVVVHDTEGGWDASVATLQNDPDKSVQYIVGTDGHVAQFVTEETTAWHAGNYWYNQRSIGIEHVGYATKPYTEKQYAASAKLVDHLATKYGIPRDRTHVIGHDQVPDGTRIAQSSAPCSDSPKGCESSANFGGAANHDDPGVWEWATYMPRLGGDAKCNDVSARWSCSNDKAQAFRCAGGKVEVLACDGTGGCEPQTNGQDDVCNVAPKNVTPPATDPPPETTTTAAPLPPPGAEAPPPSDDAGGGCAASPRRKTTETSETTTLALVLVVGLAALRRRSRSR